jgi:hypothetical protein
MDHIRASLKKPGKARGWALSGAVLHEDDALAFGFPNQLESYRYFGGNLHSISMASFVLNYMPNVQ